MRPPPNHCMQPTTVPALRAGYRIWLAPLQLLRRHQAASAAVDIPAIADRNDRHDQDLVLDGVEHAVVALADPVLVMAGELLTADRPGVARERLDLGGETAPVFGGDGFEFFDGGRLDADVITCHDASGL